MKPCLDVGHRNQRVATAPESDPYAWIERYAAKSPLIHIQQCNADGSHHWPFTPSYNDRGDIRPERIISAVERSGPEHEILLAPEIRHRACYPDENMLEQNLKASVQYWRRWIAE